MIRALTSGVILLCSVSWAEAGILWFSGAETGSHFEFEQFDTGLNALASTSQVKNGVYAFAFNDAAINAGFGISQKGLGLSTGYVGFWYRQTTTPSGTVSVARWLNTAQTIAFELQQHTDDKLCFAYNNTTCIATSTTVIAANTWYFVEFKSVVNASTGGMELKINGTVEFTSFGTDTSSIGNLDQVQFGPARNTSAGRQSFQDDLAISDTGYITSAGIVIARQGAAGSPTYTAWTKNSCTGGLIENCWSQTPFDTTPNATSSTASAAQTMLVHDFATTQTGHGSNVIQASDVVNACKVGVTGITASTHSITVRRRLSGVDTDGTVTLTTNPKYVDPGPFSTTATVVRGSTMELGVVHDGGTTLDTIYDGWMNCHYTAVSVGPRHRVNFD